MKKILSLFRFRRFLEEKTNLTKEEKSFIVKELTYSDGPVTRMKTLDEYKDEVAGDMSQDGLTKEEIKDIFDLANTIVKYYVKI